MTKKVKQDLLNFKSQIASLDNLASQENIDKAALIIRQISTYISVHIAESPNKAKCYEELQILLNWLNDKAEDDNKTKMIVVKENALSNIELVLNIDNSVNNEKNTKQKVKSNNIFIVHGHEETMKLAVSDVIRRLGLTPIILHEQPDRNRTIIEKFEDVASEASFAVVLLSPDDEVTVDHNKTFRARQNVILELGYFCGKLGRENVLALYDTSKGDVIELPSDISGVLYKPYDKPYGDWRIALASELKAAGYRIDVNDLLK